MHPSNDRYAQFIILKTCYFIWNLIWKPKIWSHILLHFTITLSHSSAITTHSHSLPIYLPPFHHFFTPSFLGSFNFFFIFFLFIFFFYGGINCSLKLALHITLVVIIATPYAKTTILRYTTGLSKLCHCTRLLQSWSLARLTPVTLYLRSLVSLILVTHFSCVEFFFLKKCYGRLLYYVFLNFYFFFKN